MTENENDRLREENRRRRIDQILATGMTREEMAEALQSAERSAHIWQTCTNAVRKENAELRELVRSYAEIANYVCDRNPVCGDGFMRCKYEDPHQCVLGKLNDKLSELEIEVDE